MIKNIICEGADFYQKTKIISIKFINTAQEKWDKAVDQLAKVGWFLEAKRNGIIYPFLMSKVNSNQFELNEFRLYEYKPKSSSSGNLQKWYLVNEILVWKVTLVWLFGFLNGRIQLYVHKYNMDTLEVIAVSNFKFKV